MLDNIGWRRDACLTTTGDMVALKADVKSSESTSDTPDSVEELPLIVEVGNTFFDTEYRHLRQDLASWNMISSAPAFKTNFSSEDIAQIHIKDLNPIIVVDSNGGEVTLPGSFALDISPAEKSYTSSGSLSLLSFGELKRIKDPRRLQSKSDHVAIDDMRRMLLGESIPRAMSTSPDYLAENTGARYHRVVKEKEATTIMGVDLSIDRIGGVQTESPHCHSKIDEAGKKRFQLIVERLNKLGSAPKFTHCNHSITDHQARDAAVVRFQGTTAHEAIDGMYQQQVAWQQAISLRGSGDSGYNSANSISEDHVSKRHASAASEKTKQVMRQDSPSKKLNPLATEFSSTRNYVEGEFIMYRPSRHPRPHINTLFPDLDSHGSLQNTDHRTRADISAAGSSNIFTGLSDNNTPFISSAAPASQVPADGSLYMDGSSLFIQVPDFTPNTPIASILSTQPVQYQVEPQLPAIAQPISIPAVSTCPTSSTFKAFGLPQPNVTPHSTFPMPRNTQFKAFQSDNSLGHFPRPLHPSCLPLAPGGDIGLPRLPQPSQRLWANTNPRVTAIPSQSLNGGKQDHRNIAFPSLPTMGPMDKQVGIATTATNGSLCRRTFPVTKKPRDHDPIKQQKYEEYLEYRKMFEPGYHQAAKVRQANRFARQHYLPSSHNVGSGPA
jgi:hypothetical protein